MKQILMMAAILCSVFASQSSWAQAKSTIKNDTLQVWGNCESCKTRIEKAAKSAGALSANWEAETQMLAMTFDTEKTSAAQIEEAIAQKGHDTQDVTATEASYKKLPGCCKYDRKEAVEEAE